MDETNLEQFWTNRYIDKLTGWDIGYPSTPLKEYIDQIEDKSIRILIPGSGNAYEAEYLFSKGFKNVFVMDISKEPLTSFKDRVPDFPKEHLLQEDFFTHKSQYDLIFEQTFFCSFEPTTEQRTAYAKKMNALLKPEGKLVGLWFNHPLFEGAKRPYGGTREEYLSYLTPHFEVLVFELAHNSIKPRSGTELFGIFVKK